MTHVFLTLAWIFWVMVGWHCHSVGKFESIHFEDAHQGTTLWLFNIAMEKHHV